MPRNILVIHGPNLNFLGKREPAVYGSTTLSDINGSLETQGRLLGASVTCFQSNHEGAIIDCIQDAWQKVDGILINPAAFTHTSVGIRDALLLHEVPIIEIHLSNIHKREAFRHHSHVSDIATGQIVGLGARGYLLALEAMMGILDERSA